MRVVHAAWTGDYLLLWAEDSERAKTLKHQPASELSEDRVHPFTSDADTLLKDIFASLDHEQRESVRTACSTEAYQFVLPEYDGVPIPSPSATDSAALHATSARTNRAGTATVECETYQIPCVRVAKHVVQTVLEALLSPRGREHVNAGGSLHFFGACAKLADAVVVSQRYIPMLAQDLAGATEARWHPWISDSRFGGYVGTLIEAMPVSARALVSTHEHQPWPIVESFLAALIDADCRTGFVSDNLIETVEDRDAGEDPHVALLGGLLGSETEIKIDRAGRTNLVKGVRRWLAGLEDRGTNTQWQMVMRVAEPVDVDLVRDLEAPPDAMTWDLTFHLRAVDAPRIQIDASDVWMLSADGITIEGRRLDSPHELILGELARAARMFKPIERVLREAEPASVSLVTRDAYKFLREAAPLLTEQGFHVEAPAWWDLPTIRIGARLHIDTDPIESIMEGAGVPGAARPRVGLGSLVDYRWELEIGGATLTIAEFEQLALQKSPLVRINGQWVEIRPEDVKAAMAFVRDRPAGKMSVLEAIRVGYGVASEDVNVSVLGIEATGWVKALLGEDVGSRPVPDIAQPQDFHGTLRPYQLRGLSWLAFLEQFGLGACLADDMGLGKTIQLLALMQLERERIFQETESNGGVPPEHRPTLLIVPTSVVGNWVHEAQRFCPTLRVLVHHGPDRMQMQDFVGQVQNADAVITTYSLSHRDRETLGLVHWGRVVLDEAQFIKNPSSKQTQAVRALEADRRIALTGTPVENRLAELWSIMDFLNPGYLGSAQGFRKRFAIPIERYRDQSRSVQLRHVIQPFILRRLKSDPGVITDLPEKIESREYAALTSEQAELYESCVSRMIKQIETSDGIQRRGLVLAALIRLKQICNHPTQVLHDCPEGSVTSPEPARSGKSMRLLEMLEEVLDRGEQAIIFSQFRQMGSILQRMIETKFKRDVLFLHGGVPSHQRDELVRKFQAADGQYPVLVASLKAGGVGLNLTAASHVFHYDRWWNPAVENQATDRAYRIGQMKTVHVHKFVVSGTLEERIDEMIEMKTELSERIIGSGERWLTELDTDQLRNLLTLNHDAIEVGA
ncbi:MAG: DEAD/DEAH box helicase [Phycisphaerales bacterium]